MFQIPYALTAMLMASATAAPLVSDAPPVCSILLAPEPDFDALRAEVKTWREPYFQDWYDVCTRVQVSEAIGQKPDLPFLLVLLTILAPPVGLPATVDYQARPTPGYTPAQFESVTVEMLVGAHIDPRVPLLFAEYGMDQGMVAKRFKAHIERGELEAARVFLPMAAHSAKEARSFGRSAEDDTTLFSDRDGERSPLPKGDWLSHPDFLPAMGAVGFDLCPLVLSALSAGLADKLSTGVGACDDGLSAAMWFGWDGLAVPVSDGAFDARGNPQANWPGRVATLLGVDAVHPGGPAARYWSVRVGYGRYADLTHGDGPPERYPQSWLPAGWREVPFEFRWGNSPGNHRIPLDDVAALDDAVARCDAPAVLAVRTVSPDVAPTQLGWFSAAESCPDLALELARTGAMPELDTPLALHWDLGPEVSAVLGEVVEFGPGMGWAEVSAFIPEAWSAASRRALRKAIRRRGAMNGNSVWWRLPRTR